VGKARVGYHGRSGHLQWINPIYSTMVALIVAVKSLL